MSEFLPMFRGFTSHVVIRQTLEKLQEGGLSGNHDSQQPQAMQFFPTMPLREIPVSSVSTLFRILKEGSKSVSKRSIPRVLGCVGEEAFRRICGENVETVIPFPSFIQGSLGSRENPLVYVGKEHDGGRRYYCKEHFPQDPGADRAGR